MSKINTVPIIVQQLIESFLSDSTQDYIKVNQQITLENIRDVCESALLDHKKKALKKRK